MMYYTFVGSPIGQLLLAGEDDALSILAFQSGPKARGADTHWERDDERFAEAGRQLAEYFAGKRRQFELPLAPSGTPFQLSVYEALARVPYGETVSYLDLAKEIGNPKAVRAVGGANGANPLAIVLPCHRVIGSSGSLTGFGGGLDVKRFLLELETNNSGLFAS
ncbi:MAG: methylated-DNA--[protein]-cysteine S-methyltransferase [Pseudomonadaceae bacterium]|nr:methylated-DNA--[protein]-cysteine S-methyltransferase [Pseudomonadaceae bacterium]